MLICNLLTQNKMSHEQQHPAARNQQVDTPLEMMQRKELAPDVPFALDLTNPTISPHEASQTYGIQGNIVGVVALPAGSGKEQQLALVDYGPGGVKTDVTPEEEAVGKRPELARFAMIGLNYTDKDGYKPYVVLPATGEMEFSRTGDAHNVRLGIDRNPAVSRGKHFKVVTSPDGLSVLDQGSRFGTKMVGNRLTAGQQLVEAVPEEPNVEDTLPRPLGASALSGAVQAENLRTPEGGQEAQYGFTQDQLRVSIDKDERFTAITAPFNAQLTVLYQAYRGGKITEREWQSQSQPVRDQLEQAVKPYLTERLRAISNDTQAGYVHPGALYRDRMEVVTRDGKKIAWSFNGRHWSDNGIRMGQITLPKRFTSWGSGRGNVETVNRKTGRKTSSSQHIIDLAAAMQAGNFDAPDEPVIISRDTQADYDLPPQFQGVVRLYKVELGQHRVAADRLMNGFDAPVRYDRIEER